MQVLLDEVEAKQRIQRDYDDEIAGGSISGIGGLMSSIRDLTFGDDFGAGSLRAGMANSPVVPPDIGDIEGMLGGEERAFDVPIEAEIGMAVIPGGGGKGKGISSLFKSLGKSLDPEDGRTLDKMSNRSTEMPKIREMLDNPPSKKSIPPLTKPGRRQPPTSDPLDTLRHQKASLEGQLRQDVGMTRATRQKIMRQLAEIERQLRAPKMAAGGRPMYKKGYYGKSYK
jgi:hypothetical protein